MEDYHRLYRADDPDTSKMAAEDLCASGKMQRDKEVALNWLRRMPGATSKEIEAAMGHSRNGVDGKVRKRLNDLRLEGRAKKGERRACKITGKTAHVWYEVTGAKGQTTPNNGGRTPKALLNAAAPQLLTALKTMLSAWIKLGLDTPSMPGKRTIAEEARAAIAKAEGDS